MTTDHQNYLQILGLSLNCINKVFLTSSSKETAVMPRIMLVKMRRGLRLILIVIIQSTFAFRALVGSKLTD